MELILSEAKCTGCRACEAACSWHHRRAFQPSIASLMITPAGDGATKRVVRYPDMETQARAGRLACDLCRGEPAPLCARYCPFGAIEVAT